MLFGPNKKQREEYASRVREFLTNNDVKILSRLSRRGYEVCLDEVCVGQAFKDFPKAAWLNNKRLDVKLKTFLKFAGYNFIKSDDYIYFPEGKRYQNEVKKYLNQHNIMDKIDLLCRRSVGGISYEKLYEVLPYKYPKNPFIAMEDEKKNVIVFLKECDLIFRYDDQFLYFL